MLEYFLGYFPRQGEKHEGLDGRHFAQWLANHMALGQLSTSRHACAEQRIGIFLLYFF